MRRVLAGCVPRALADMHFKVWYLFNCVHSVFFVLPVGARLDGPCPICRVSLAIYSTGFLKFGARWAGRGLDRLGLEQDVDCPKASGMREDGACQVPGANFDWRLAQQCGCTGWGLMFLILCAICIPV